MDLDLTAVLTFTVLVICILPLVMIRLRKSKKIRQAESVFIKNKVEDYAVLFFYGDEFEIKDYAISEQDRIEGYYANEVYAIEGGEYEMSCILTYPYNPGGGPKGQNLFTRKLYLKMQFIKGRVYRLRLLEWSAVNKKQPFKEVYSQTFIAKPREDVKMSLTLVLEELL